MADDYDPAKDGEGSYLAAIEAKRQFLERVRAAFDYNPETGALTWRVRERAEFPSKRGHSIWNARYPGREAGHSRRDGYKIVRFNGQRYLAHRLAWLIVHGGWPAFIDHIDGDTGNNKLSNLRDVSISENGQNTKRSVRNTSGVIGVRWCGRDERWRAEITVAGKQHYLGDFVDFDDAVSARRAAERLHGFHPNHGRAAA